MSYVLSVIAGLPRTPLRLAPIRNASQPFLPKNELPPQLASVALLHRLAVLGRLTSQGSQLKPLAAWLAATPLLVAFSRLVSCWSANVASAALPMRVAMYLYEARPISAE